VAGVNINRVVMTGNLTADPELRALPSGTSVCSMRIASNTRRKNGQTGEWESKPNYFNVTVWGVQGENCAEYLAKGRSVALDGRLEWREWEANDGTKRQATDIIAESVQFLSDGGGNREGGGSPAQSAAPAASGADVPGGSGGDFSSVPATGPDDDIPF
jgi:single-strand DNA-binding protein